MKAANSPAKAASLRIAVAYATTGRRETLTDTLEALLQQRRMPDAVGICPGKPEDVDREALSAFGLGIRYAKAPIGLCAQRNALLDLLEDADVILFLDDDFIMAPNYLAECEALFLEHANVVMATGHVIADGILGPGLSLAEANTALAADTPTLASASHVPVYNGYGCNMALRRATAHAKGIRFDEALPSYGWLEDVDFSRRLAPYGDIVISSLCRGVHMGTKRGRSPGVRLGYSQISNPYYMWRKGSLTGRRAAAQVGRNMLANLAGLLRPQPWVDRRGRARGNLAGLRDVLGRRSHPQRAMDLA